MCAECGKFTAPQRYVCSGQCAAALAQADQLAELLLKKNVQSARANAINLYLCGLLSAAAAVGAWYYLPVPFLMWFTGGCSVVFIVSGIWHSRIARKQSSR